MKYGEILGATEKFKVVAQANYLQGTEIRLTKKQARSLNIDLPTKERPITYHIFVGFGGEYWPLVLKRSDRRCGYWLFSYGFLTRTEIADYINKNK